MTPIYTILLVEGRKPTAEHLAPIINDQGYNVVTARTRREAWAKVQGTRPAAIVLDSPSLRFSSRRFCDALRDAALEIPVLMLLPEGEKINRSMGASVYLRYPFSAKKLINRVTRLLPAPDGEILQVGDVILNVEQRRVTCGRRESRLTPKQARLLQVFMRHPGEILTRAFLMKQVWDTDYMGDTRTLDVHIHWVRKAIEENAKSPVYLRTVRRVGYRFQPPEKK
ncbi:MAG: response regulator transcription factor [Chloroflexota bacterium]|nr:response regulator transcription factor [Chloroflexota bacterium]